MLHPSGYLKITIFFFTIEILAALGVETLEELVQIINQMERESIQEVEENTNEIIQSLVGGINFEEPMDWDDNEPLKSWQSSDNGSESQQQQQQQQQPILQPFCSNEVKLPVCSSYISLASSEPFDPQVGVTLINILIHSIFYLSNV